MGHKGTGGRRMGYGNWDPVCFMGKAKIQFLIFQKSCTIDSLQPKKEETNQICISLL